uniref:Protein kinase domain-containing protein n=1 Tax=Glossina pallidipes TaxID=7398 RepID=A0A1B0AC99_GLOPL
MVRGDMATKQTLSERQITRDESKATENAWQTVVSYKNLKKKQPPVTIKGTARGSYVDVAKNFKSQMNPEKEVVNINRWPSSCAAKKKEIAKPLIPPVLAAKRFGKFPVLDVEGSSILAPLLLIPGFNASEGERFSSKLMPPLSYINSIVRLEGRNPRRTSASSVDPMTLREGYSARAARDDLEGRACKALRQVYLLSSTRPYGYIQPRCHPVVVTPSDERQYQYFRSYLNLLRFDGDLHSLIKGGRVHQKSVLTLAIQTVNVLEKLDDPGCCHNDIKTQNLMI